MQPPAWYRFALYETNTNEPRTTTYRCLSQNCSHRIRRRNTVQRSKQGIRHRIRQLQDRQRATLPNQIQYPDEQQRGGNIDAASRAENSLGTARSCVCDGECFWRLANRSLPLSQGIDQGPA